jgi:hypothetical protein
MFNFKIVLSCLSVRPYGTNQFPLEEFCEILYLDIFGNYADKIQFSLRCDKNKGYFT